MVRSHPDRDRWSARSVKMTREVVDGIAVIGPAEPVQIEMNNVERFEAAFARMLEEEDRDVVFDASRVEYFDSAGMGALLSLQKGVQQRKGRLVICGLNRSVAEVFRMVGFDVVFATFPDAGAASRSLK